MPDLEDGESIEVQGSGSSRYTLKNMGEVYSCTCPAWRNQSSGLDRRTCKHLKALRGEAAELARVGGAAQAAASPKGKPAPAGAAAGAAASASDQEGPPILLANPWDNAQDLAGWWMSEKLDGVRAYWDGKVFLSRLGNRYHAPDWFTEGLPDFPLDGELWGGRKRFQRTISVVRRQDKSDDWKEIAFVVFDAPALSAPFEDRQEACRRAIEDRKPAYARYHAQDPCKDVGHLREELRRVESLGGEGLMMRKPGSRYEVGRSSSLLKVKSFFDAEARVLEHLPGTGRHKGRLGALLVELPDGTRFSVGTGFSDKEREAPPPVGAVVTFRYQELSDAGVPRFPSYVGVRDDIKWPPDNAPTKKAATSPAPAASGGVAPPPGSGGPTKAPAAAKEPSASKAAPTSAPAPAPTPTPTPTKTEGAAPAGRFEVGKARCFELPGGSSKAFWEIEVRGREVTVRSFGSWASGQSRSRELASDEAALREAEALVKEKAREGYREI